ncbi:mucin-binding protein [Pediococcus pentosaceus]|uniref:mucin-binding protein n=1 Tax=Pediococcus pentosaceus TaxID=1255 RepID=UPI003FD849B4
MKYFDDTIGRKLSEQLLHGTYGSRDVYRTANTIQRYKQMGYELVSDNYPKNGANYSQDKLVRVYEIHLKHKIIEQSEKSTVKEVIHYLYDNGQPAGPIYENKLDFKRIIKFDQVTKQKHYGNWQAIDGTYFKKVDSPKIIGYTPTLEAIETINNIDGSHKDIEETVVYKINDEKAQVTYYDDTTRKKLSEKELNGAYRTRDSYRTVDAINQYKWAGYELVSDDYPQNGVFYDQDKLIKMYEVHLKHGEKMDFEQRAVKEVIYYQYDDGQLAEPTYKNKLSFRRIVKIDQVTGQKYYGVWQAVDGTNFRSVVSPIIEGYTPIPEIVRAINNLKINDLLRYINMTQGAISKLVNRLVEYGFVEKYHMKGNQKDTYLRLTNLGRKVEAIHHQFHQELEQRLEQALDQFTEQDIRITVSVLKKINAARNQLD